MMTLLDGNDNVNVILKCPPRRVSTYLHALFSHREVLLQHCTPLHRKSYIQDDMVIWSYRSNLASSWTIKHLFFTHISIDLFLLCEDYLFSSLDFHTWDWYYVLTIALKNTRVIVYIL